MKKYIIMFSVILTALGSCDVQLDEVFDDTAASRVDKQVAEAYEILTAASNGWIMEYYPNTDQAYGGVNILVKFNPDNSVMMINETISDVNAVKSSTYVINRSQSAVLAFDTYNEYICYYADPSLEEGEGRRYGYMGDLDFAIMSLSESEVVLRGTKTQNRIVLRAIPESKSWAQYLSDVQKVQTEVFYNSVIKFVLHHQGQTRDFVADVDYPLFSYSYMDEEGIEKTHVVSYMYTDTGIKFYEPVEIFGIQIQNFVWDAESVRFYCTDPGLEDVFMQGEQEYYFRPYEFFLGEWTFYCAGTAGGTYDITITEQEYGKSLWINGLTYTSSSEGEYNYPITLTWNRSGLVEVKKNQIVGKKLINGIYHDIYIRICSASGYDNSTSNSSMISRPDFQDNPNRVDFESNGAWVNTEGFGYYYHYDGTNYTRGKFLTPMYMVKKQ